MRLRFCVMFTFGARTQSVLCPTLAINVKNLCNMNTIYGLGILRARASAGCAKSLIPGKMCWADDSQVTRAYLAALDIERFKPIDRFFVREAGLYHLDTSEPVRIRLRTELHDRPPQRAADAGLFATALWSLRLRYWAWRASGHAHEPEDIRLFLLYHDPALTPTVPHSLGLTKGLIGVVYAFAAPEMNDENDVVIAHELLHTVGATDKYNVLDDAPRFPDGFGNPAQVPLYPQLTAELMAGRRMVAADKWQQAASLDEVVIGPATALEIRWPQHAR